MAEKWKTPAFLLGYERDGGEYVVYARDPILIARVTHFGDDEAAWMAAQKNVALGARTVFNGDHIMLECVHGITSGAVPNDQAGANRFAEIMSRMGDWYFYIMKEREAHDRN